MTPTARSCANRNAALLLALLIFVPGLPSITRAISILPTSNGLQTFFWAVCDNGYMSGPWPDIGTAMNIGGIQCGPFGGIAQITDQAVIEARADRATCAAPSSITIEEDQGGGVTRQITQAELDTIVTATGGVGQILASLTMASVSIRGAEVWPDPPMPLLSRIPIREIYNDEDGDGALISVGFFLLTQRRLA